MQPWRISVDLTATIAGLIIRSYRLSRGLSDRCSVAVATDSNSSRTESGEIRSASARRSRRLFARNNCIIGLCHNSIDHRPSAPA